MKSRVPGVTFRVARLLSQNLLSGLSLSRKPQAAERCNLLRMLLPRGESQAAEMCQDRAKLSRCRQWSTHHSANLSG